MTITNLDKLDEPASLTRLSEQVTGLLPKVDLTELVLEIHAHTGFADEFSHVSEANARLVDYQSTLALAKKWGGGEVASADGMRLVTPVRTINAEGR